MTSVRMARGINLLPSDIDGAIVLLRHRLKLVEGVERIRHYLITKASQEDFEALIDICDELLRLEDWDAANQYSLQHR